MVDAAWIEERITQTKATIVAIETAILALSSGAQSYTLDTGQSRQTVTKANLSELKNTLKYFEDRLNGLEGDLSSTVNGPPTFYMR